MRCSAGVTADSCRWRWTRLHARSASKNTYSNISTISVGSIETCHVYRFDRPVQDLLLSLTIRKGISRILVHPTCPTTHLGLSETLLEIAGALAGSAEIPSGTTCCGTAGDRGLLHPELVRSATRDTIVQIQSSGTRFASSLRIGPANWLCVELQQSV